MPRRSGRAAHHTGWLVGKSERGVVAIAIMCVRQQHHFRRAVFSAGAAAVAVAVAAEGRALLAALPDGLWQSGQAHRRIR